MSPTLERLQSANPVPDETVEVKAAWREDVRRRIESGGGAPIAPVRRGRRGRLLLAAGLVALLALPSYGVARSVVEWMLGEPAPQTIVEEFDSYAPQLGFRPDGGAAVLVAREGEHVRLYSTPNNRGSYCVVLRAPRRPTGDGGTCVQPAWAAEPLIAGLLGTAGGDDEGATMFVGGRATHAGASSIRFAGPDGRAIVRPVGHDGFFVASVRVPHRVCAAGGWRPTFLVQDAEGAELARAEITLLFARPEGVCVSIPPHPPHIR